MSRDEPELTNPLSAVSTCPYVIDTPMSGIAYSSSRTLVPFVLIKHLKRFVPPGTLGNSIVETTELLLMMGDHQL